MSNTNNVFAVKSEPCSPPKTDVGNPPLVTSIANNTFLTPSMSQASILAMAGKQASTSSVVIAPTARPGVFQITGTQFANLANAGITNQKVTCHQIEASTLQVLQQTLGITSSNPNSTSNVTPVSVTVGRKLPLPISTATYISQQGLQASSAGTTSAVRHMQPQAQGIINRTVIPLPMQLKQGQRFSVRAPAPKQAVIIPKSSISPSKHTQMAPQRFVPIAVSSGVPTPTSGGTVTVRPIAPRMFSQAVGQQQQQQQAPSVPNTITQIANAQVMQQRNQSQLYPKTAGTAPQQPQTFILPTPSQQGQTALLPGAVLATNSGFRQVYRLVTPSGQLVPVNYVQPIAAKANACLLPQPYQEQIEPETQIATNGAPQVDAKVLRKPCNCTKSQCLKLYCDCFANGEFCIDCNCNNCYNNLEHESDRGKAIKQCLERNAFAFHPKIGKGKGEAERMHTKGCHCKRSGCLKNYCECYEAKILCSALCKCTGCKNFEESPERKTLMHLADAAEVRVLQQTAAQTKLQSQMEQYPSRLWAGATEDSRLPFSFITSDVAMATADCLLLTAEESIKRGVSQTQTEHAIIEEFGRCLMQIIHTSNKSKELLSQSPD